MPKGIGFLKTYSCELTRQQYQYIIASFLSSVNGSEIKHSQLEGPSAEYFDGKRAYQTDVENYYATLSGRPPKSVQNHLAVVRTFLVENEVELPLRFWKGLNRRRKGSRALTIDRVPTTEELKRIIQHLPLNGKALLMVLASSGMRIGEATQLKLSDVDLTRDPPLISIRGGYTKSGNSRIAFISGESKEILQEWLRNRDAYLKRAVARSGNHFKDPKDERIFPYDKIMFNVQLTEALSRTGLCERDARTKRVTIHPHSLRKRFRSLMATAIPADVAEALMGHEGYLTDVYRRFSQEQLAEFYRKGEPTLALFSNAEEVLRLKDEIAQKERTIQTLLTGHTVELIELRQKLSELESRVPVNPIQVAQQVNAELRSK